MKNTYGVSQQLQSVINVALTGVDNVSVDDGVIVPVSVVSLSNGGIYHGNVLSVVVGTGDAPKELVVKTPDGHLFTLRHSNATFGDGHGDDQAYTEGTWMPDHVPGVWWNYDNVDLTVVDILSC